MKLRTVKYRLTVGLTACIFYVHAATTIPKSYIVEYAQDNLHDMIDDGLSQYRDLYDIHHTYSSSIFHGMSFSLKEPNEMRATQHKPFSPVSYSSSNDKKHPVFEHLQNHPAIKRIYPNYEVPRPQWMSNSEKYDHTFPYDNSDTQVYDIHKKFGITGEGILVGVLDSGECKTFLTLERGVMNLSPYRSEKNLINIFKLNFNQ